MEQDNGISVFVSTTPLDVSAACAAVSDPAHGAIDLFVGVVRNSHQGQAVTGITYDVHETLALATFRDICCEAQHQWPGTRYYLAHFHGYLDVGGISVLIAASSPHRAEAFEACRHVIEEIKKRAPVWKKEHYISGESAWLPGHSLAPAPEEETVCCGKCRAHG